QSRCSRHAGTFARQGKTCLRQAAESLAFHPHGEEARQRRLEPCSPAVAAAGLSSFETHRCAMLLGLGFKRSVDVDADTGLYPHGEEARQRRLEPCSPAVAAAGFILRDASLRDA